MNGTSLLVSMVGTSLPRAVARCFPDLLWRVPTTSKTAYLTFDDGPDPATTGEIARVLERFDARATFFLVGLRAERNPSYVHDLTRSGHAIGNHSFSHPDAWRIPASRLVNDLERATGVLQDLTGEPIGWMRPPYGRFTRAMRTWSTTNAQQLTMWDLGPGDYLDGITSQDVCRHVEGRIRPGSIIVLHDNPRRAPGTPRLLEGLLARLTDGGWKFPVLPRAA